MKKLYVFNNGGSPGWYSAQCISEDGIFLASHICSDECFMPHDMGVTGSDWKHEVYNKYAPDGWTIEFVPYHEVASHDGLQDALKKYDALTAQGLPTSFKEASFASVTVEFSDEEEKTA